MKATKTTYTVNGCKELCFEIKSDNDAIMVRVAPYYHFVGKNTLYLTEYINGEFNNSEEMTGNFKSLTKTQAVNLAKEFCAYLNH